MNGGIIGDIDTARATLGAVRDELFADLEPVLIADNEMLKAEAASSPARSGGSRSTGGGKAFTRPPASTPGNAYKGDAAQALTEVITFGKFKVPEGNTPLTYKQVLEMSASEAAEYGHVDKQGNGRTGRSYLEWLQTNENNAWAAEVAQLVLGTVKVAA